MKKEPYNHRHGENMWENPIYIPDKNSQQIGTEENSIC